MPYGQKIHAVLNKLPRWDKYSPEVRVFIANDEGTRGRHYNTLVALPFASRTPHQLGTVRSLQNAAVKQLIQYLGGPFMGFNCRE